MSRLLIGIAVAAILDYLVTTKGSGIFLRLRPLAYIGRVSYGMYLLHPLTLGLCAFLFDGRNAGTSGMVVFVTGTVAFAGLSFKYFEGPILAQKKRFERA